MTLDEFIESIIKEVKSWPEWKKRIHDIPDERNEYLNANSG